MSSSASSATQTRGNGAREATLVPFRHQSATLRRVTRASKKTTVDDEHFENQMTRFFAYFFVLHELCINMYNICTGTQVCSSTIFSFFERTTITLMLGAICTVERRAEGVSTLSSRSSCLCVLNSGSNRPLRAKPERRRGVSEFCLICVVVIYVSFYQIMTENFTTFVFDMFFFFHIFRFII